VGFVLIFVFLGWRILNLSVWPWVISLPDRIAHHPVWLLALLPLGALIGWGLRQGWAHWRRRVHVRAVLTPLYAALRTLLGLPDDDDPGTWLDVPVRFRETGQGQVRLVLPAYFLEREGVQAEVHRLFASRLGHQLDARWNLTETPMTVVFTRQADREPLPREVAWQNTGQQYEVMVGRTYGRTVTVSTQTETPHYAVGANTGGGKTTALLVPVVHARSYGTLVDLIDVKEDSYKGAVLIDQDGHLVCDVPGIRVHTTAQDGIWCLAEFFTSMKAVALAKAAGYTEPIPDRLLVIDEFGSFMTSALTWWKYTAKGKGTPPFMGWFHMCLMQGRTKGHRLVVGTHDFKDDTFGGTNIRNLFGTKIWIGPCPGPTWVSAFGWIPRVEPQTRADGKPIPGRALLNITGQDEVLEVQLAYLAPEQAHTLLLGMPAAPEWFTRGQMAPWITDKALELADAEAAVGPFLTLGREVDQPAGQQPTRLSALPAEPAEPVLVSPCPPVSAQLAAGETTPTPGHQDTGTARPKLALLKNELERVTGMKAAAELLDMSLANFTKTRQRALKAGRPIPGERREGRQLSWPAEALRAWRGLEPTDQDAPAQSIEPGR